MGRIQHCMSVQKPELLDSEKKKNCNVSHGYVESLILVGACEHLAGSIPHEGATDNVAGVAARRDVSRKCAHALPAPENLYRHLVLTHSDKQQPTATTIRHRKQSENNKETTNNPPKGSTTTTTRHTQTS